MDLTFEAAALLPLAAVILIDIVLSGDNAIILGLAASGLPAEQRKRVITLGVILATLMRVAFAFVALPMLSIIGLTLAGGILLLWVAWKIWREAHPRLDESTAIEDEPTRKAAVRLPGKTPRQAILQIAVADLSMSLDNVLAVAGAARDHPWVLAVGLALSVSLMAFAAQFVARMLDRYHWLVYVGLAVVTIVALRMIWEGGIEVLHASHLF
jgi:YjbE family integral membrane protein